MSASVSNVIALIPARAGSKGIPGKNIKLFDGIPLIAYSIVAALKAQKSCPSITNVIVSTDSEEIATIARKYGADVPWLRPAEHASDQAPGIAPVLHALDVLPDAEHILLLQPTSPFRSSGDITDALRQYTMNYAVVSVCKSEQHPAWMYTLDEVNQMRNCVSFEASRRQDLPDVYHLNGAIYIASRSQLENSRTFINPSTRAYKMPRERSLDIDELLDWEIAEFLAKHWQLKREVGLA